MEQLLKQIENDETLATLKKVIQNTAQAPTEAKFRKLKLSNPKIKELLVDVPGALESLVQFGWVKVFSAPAAAHSAAKDERKHHRRCRRLRPAERGSIIFESSYLR